MAGRFAVGATSPVQSDCAGPSSSVVHRFHSGAHCQAVVCREAFRPIPICATQTTSCAGTGPAALGFITHVRWRNGGEPGRLSAVCGARMKSLVPAVLPTRRARSVACALAACGVIGFFAGCASEPESHVVSAPPPPPPTTAPATVYTQPYAQPYSAPATIAAVPSPTGASSIVVMQAPPAAQQEVPSPRPSAEHVWIAGYWSWKSDHYEWTGGHWEIPPRSGAVWVPPRWQPEGSSWRFYEGYWD